MSSARASSVSKRNILSQVYKLCRFGSKLRASLPNIASEFNKFNKLSKLSELGQCSKLIKLSNKFSSKLEKLSH